MKPARLVLAVLFSLGAVSFAASEREPFVGIWKVNWEKSAPTIQGVPGMFTSRVKTVEEFRNFVAQRAEGLVVEIHPNYTAIFNYPKERAKLVWEREGQRHDIWLQQKFFLKAASIGHGFKVTGPDTATLTYQVELHEDAATRIPLFLERQAAAPGYASNTWPLITLLLVGLLVLVRWVRWRSRRNRRRHGA